MGWKLRQALNEKLKLLEGSRLSSPPERAAHHSVPEKATPRDAPAAQSPIALVLLGSPIKHNRTVCLLKDAGPGVVRQRAPSGCLVLSLQQAKRWLFGKGLHQEPFEFAENLDGIQHEIGSGHAGGAKRIP